MGSFQGFLDFKRKGFSYKSIEERLKSFDEFLIIQDDTEIKKQAGRCMDCDTPYCYALGCPSLNLIPEWNDYIFRKDFKSAYERLTLTSSFPEITGRVCPGLCEAACSLSINLAPVTIKQIELYIIEKAFMEGLVQPILPISEKRQRIAIIGSGPAGLAAAQELRRMGYQITVYEKSDALGGLMRYGIPEFKLPKWVIDRRIELMEQEGVEFKTNVDVGVDISMNRIKDNFDCVLLCMGSGTPRELSIEGSSLEGIYYALEYLTKSTKCLTNKVKDHEIINVKDKSVLVIGGGDTGSDCIGTANRQGAKKITQIEIMPEPRVWNESYNPTWPNYPSILRTSSSHEEGCIRDFNVSTKSFISKDGCVAGAKCVRVKWVKNENNSFVMKEIDGSDFVIDADYVFLSMGFTHVEHSKMLEDLGIKYDARGNIEVNTKFETNIKGVFAAGDAFSGASLVVRAMKSGRLAANAINEFL